jgi:acyl carrier protein
MDEIGGRRTTMEEKVLEILEEHCEEALDYDGDSMMEDGIIDSFAVIQVVSDLEEVFDIEIDAKYVIEENFCNKEAIIELVRKLLEE